jgi:hypothetical protein
VDDETAVTEVSTDAVLCRDELIIERKLKGVRSDLAMLATQVTDLTSLREAGVTWRILPTNEGVKMSECLGAVAVGGNGIDVDVIGWRQNVSDNVVNEEERTESLNLLNGPPCLGRLLNWTLNQAPMPLGLAVAAMEPLTLPEGNAALSKAAAGSEAE